MSPVNVVVFSRSSIFAAGIVENITEMKTVGSACVIEPTQEKALQRLIELKPNAIIFDETDNDIYQKISTDLFLELIPDAVLIKVSLGNGLVSIVTNLSHSTRGIRNLIDAVQDLAKQGQDTLDLKKT